MAEIRPFRGWRYNTALTGELGSLIAPPYDIISPTEQASLYARNPYNVVRLERTAPEANDPAGAAGEEARHERARVTLEDWARADILHQDPDPSIYLHEQTFDFRGAAYRRRSIFVAARLYPWSAGRVLPHERTLKAPREERLALLRATSANISPIWALYEDTEQQVEAALDAAMEGEPLAEATDEQGGLHRLWHVSERHGLEQFSHPLVERQFFIADGHHRYETAVAYRDEGRERPGRREAGPRDFTLMALTAVTDPGLIVLPTHRLIHGLPKDRVQALPAWLSDHFAIEERALPADAAALEALLDRELAGSGVDGRPHRFALLGPEPTAMRLLTLRDPAAASAAPVASLQALDVWLAHTLLLERGLGLTEDAVERQEHLTYTRDVAEAARAVQQGEAQLALFLAPTPVSQLLAVARAGAVMPQKSTYFYPKPATGLVIRRLDPS